MPEILEDVTEKSVNQTTDQEIQTLESYDDSIVVENTEFYDTQPST